MIGIIRDLSDRISSFAPSVSYYFCQGTDQSAQNSAAAVVRSLIWMLVAQQPELLKHIRHEHERQHRDVIFRDERNALEAASRILKNMLMNAGSVYLIVDALDECDPDLETLLQLISTSSKYCKEVKWIVSSRPNVNVQVLLDQMRNGGEKLKIEILDLDTQDLAGLVNIYVENKLFALEGRSGYNDRVLKDLSNEIRQRNEKTYLWVSLAFDVLDEKDDDLEPIHGSYALETIKEIPPGLRRLYHHMVERIERKKRSDPVHCKNVLAVLTLARRPMSYEELSTIAGLRPTDPDLHTVVKHCGSFLISDKNKVQLVHQSAKEFLLEDLESFENGVTSKLQSSVLETNCSIITHSLEGMSKFYVSRKLQMLERHEYQALSALDLAPIHYACTSWVAHFAELWDDISQDHDYPSERHHISNEVVNFLKEHFLQWFESMAVVGASSFVPWIMDTLVHHFKVTPLETYQRRSYSLVAVRSISYA